MTGLTLRKEHSKHPILRLRQQPRQSSLSQYLSSPSPSSQITRSPRFPSIIQLKASLSILGSTSVILLFYPRLLLRIGLFVRSIVGVELEKMNSKLSPNLTGWGGHSVDIWCRLLTLIGSWICAGSSVRDDMVVATRRTILCRHVERSSD
jgi:hypothetical protein